MNYDRLDVPLIDWSQAPEDAGKNFKGPQNPKQCKKSTPDFKEGTPAVKATKKKEAKPGIDQIGFRTKDVVMIVERSEMHQTGTAAFRIPTKTLLQGIEVSGEYVFDSYDAYDNTCYINRSNSDMTYNVLLTDIKLKEDE